MKEYQNRIENLIRRIPEDISNPQLINQLRGKFLSTSFFNHSESSCKFCDPGEMRVRKESVLFATLIVDEKLNNITSLLEKIKECAFHMSPDYQIDNLFYQHVIGCLEKLKQDKSLQKQILRQSVPVLNGWSEKIIRNGLRLLNNEKITNQHIQILFLSAFFHPLRQNVGSCFATAPAILIQQEQPKQFFNDLELLLNIGMLKRTFAGYEHTIPISTSWGPGILNKIIQVQKDHALFKSSELIYCLESLKIIEKNQSLENKELELSKLIENLKLKEGSLLSLKSLIQKILQFHFQLVDKDIEKPFEVTSLKVNEIYYDKHSLSKPFGKYQKFEEFMREAELLLINFHENPLLKTWEYTFASFAETESKFYKWNLYVSLGFDSKKPFSIAACIYSYLEEKLKFYKEKIEHHDKEYEQEFYHVKMLEKRVVNTESEHTASWARVEYQNHLSEMTYHRRTRDEFIDKSERMSKLLPKILDTYDKLFPKYFQEVYDASMQEVSEDIFQDSPAGFRLIYKHGRQDPTLWTFIHSKAGFISSLKSFFTDTEFEISTQEDLKEFKDEYSEIITQIIHLVQTDNFIYAAFQRICDRYGLSFPSHDLSKLDTWPYKPWSYISGGTTERLLQHYYKREKEFTLKKQNVATETELFSFIIETSREFTQNQVKNYLADPKKSMVMLSPVHAFLFKPGWLPLNEVWDKNLYSFSWIRDYFVSPQIRFLQNIKLTPLEVHYFFNTYFSQLPYFSLWIKENVLWPNYSISLMEFREILTSCLKKIPSSLLPYAVNLEAIDSWIYECFPMISSSELYSKCISILEELGLDSNAYDKAFWITDKLIDASKVRMYIRANELFEIIKAIICFVYEKVSFERNWPELILDAMRALGLAMPKPLKFADTNWPYFNFSFVVNPASLKLELWRTNPLGNKGFPMHQWEKWFTEEKASDWGILTKPDEYLLN